MVLILIYGPKFEKCFLKLPLNIQKKTVKKLENFRENPFTNSLRVEKLNPKNKELWSFRVDREYRVVFSLNKNTAKLYFVGHHNKIYNYSIFKA